MRYAVFGLDIIRKAVALPFYAVALVFGAAAVVVERLADLILGHVNE